MFYTLAEDVAVDFITDDPQIVPLHDFRHAFQFLLRPDVACRILRIAPHQYLGKWIGRVLFQSLKIKLPAASAVRDQTVMDGMFMPFVQRMLEIPVGRCVQDGIFMVAEQEIHQCIESRNDSKRKTDLFFGICPAVHFLVPGIVSLIKFRFKDLTVADDTPVGPVLDGLDDIGTHGKFHIGHPHADKFIIPEGEFLLSFKIMENISPETVGVQCIRMIAVDHFIKIVFHDFHSCLYFSGTAASSRSFVLLLPYQKSVLLTKGWKFLKKRLLALKSFFIMENPRAFL